MIRYALSCAGGHAFEAWFSSSLSYDEQAEAGAIVCPHCGGAEISKAPMAPAVVRSKARSAKAPATNERKKTYAFLKELRAHVTANAEHVGPAFPEEARKIHYGETEERSIYGEASPEEARELQEEGIPAYPLPPLPEDHN